MRPHSFADFRVACLLKFPTYFLVPYLTFLLIYLATTLLKDEEKNHETTTLLVTLPDIRRFYGIFVTLTYSAINVS